MWSFMFKYFVAKQGRRDFILEEGTFVGVFEWDLWWIRRYHLWFWLPGLSCVRFVLTSWVSREDVWVVCAPQPSPLPPPPHTSHQQWAESMTLSLISAHHMCLRLKEAAPPSIPHPLSSLFSSDTTWAALAIASLGFTPTHSLEKVRGVSEGACCDQQWRKWQHKIQHVTRPGPILLSIP